MNPLSLDEYNVVIAGNGAIGQALCRASVSRPGVRSVALLGRKPLQEDLGSKVTEFSVDAMDSGSIASAAEAVIAATGKVHLLINTVGVLHQGTMQPEKRLRDFDRAHALQSLQVNALFVADLARAFAPALRHQDPAVFASLSARVGSIGDNRLGGWYSYRMSKAAQNMLLRTIACEWKVSHRNAAVIALHPGTVRSPLSKPFIGKHYANRVLSPDESAAAMLSVIETVTIAGTGRFYDWKGEVIPW